MRKLNFLFGTIALTAVVGCSSDEVISTKNDAAIAAKSSISFAPLASKTDTRSTVYTPSSMFTNFKVVGEWTASYSEAYINGKKEELSDINKGSIYQGFGNGLEIVKTGSGWDYKNQGEIQYWPYSATKATGSETITGYKCLPLNFRAVAPASAGIDIAGKNAWEYTTPAVADMVDVCYAKADDKTVADAPVKMVFRHLLSQVIVKAKKSSSYNVDIKDVTFGGVKSNVSYKWDAIDDSANWKSLAPKDEKEFKGFTTTNYTSIPNQDESASPAKMTPDGQELLLIPQKIQPWEPGATDGSGNKIKASDSQKGFISITYRAKTTEATEWATKTGDDDYKTVYFPLTATWEPGTKYIYTFLFGGVSNPDDPNPDGPGGDNPDPGPGYNEDGEPEPPSIPITFTATVKEWTEQVIDLSF